MQILDNINLQPFLTLQTIAYTKYFAEFSSLDELKELLNFAKKNSLKVVFLGSGANTFFKSNFDGLVLKNNLKGIEKLEFSSFGGPKDPSEVAEGRGGLKTPDSVFYKVSSGENWHEFVMKTVDENLYGLENLALIPGTVGASPIQNINAYGAQMSSTCDSVEVLDLKTLEIKTLSNKECKFSYRNSIFKQEARDKYFVTAVTFKLSKINNIDINYGNSYGSVKQILIDSKKDLENLNSKDIAQAIITLRTKKLPDPQITPNAGSTFVNVFCDEDEKLKIEEIEKDLKLRNPGLSKCEFYVEKDGRYKIPAGWLVEATGLKGKMFENVGISEKHALVVVTNGKASGEELYEFISKIQAIVFEKFGVKLQTELNII